MPAIILPSFPAGSLLTLCLMVAAAPAQRPEPIEVPWDDSLPPGTAAQVERALDESSRHGEWVDIEMAGGARLDSWVVYPERKDKAGVVLVIHDIRGMSLLGRESWRPAKTSGNVGAARMQGGSGVIHHRGRAARVAPSGARRGHSLAAARPR